MSDVRKVFTEVYDHNVWLGDESRSGEGSSREATRHIVRELPGLLRDLGVRTMLDAPCGDFAWMKDVYLGDTFYIGADVVEPLIQANVSHHGSPKRAFFRLDMLEDPLPKADLILCRDCFIHLPLPMIFDALRAMLRSEASYVLLSHYSWRTVPSNDDVPDLLLGGRRINLELPPFNFPPPLRSIIESWVPQKIADLTGDKTLALWRAEDIAAVLGGGDARLASG